MRIVIDLQGAQTESRFRGIGRYSSSLALAMASNAGDHEVWLALSAAFPESILDIRHAFDGLIPQDRIRVFDVPAPVAEHNPANFWRARAAEKIREHFLQQLKPDVIHVASLFENPAENVVTSIGKFIQDENTAVTLYDLIPLLRESIYLPSQMLKDWYYGKIDSLKNAALLLAISDYSRGEAIEALQLPADRVVNISAAIDDRFRPITLSVERIHHLRNRYGIQREMVMYAPGGFDIRKNFDGLISAYALLPAELRANHQLVIVSKVSDGDRTNLQQLRKRAGLAEDELVLTGYVSDEDLVALYNLATLFVFPSKHEGFGLPPLEAMACGTPTIGSNTTSVPEVIGWDNALFDPSSAQSIANKMVQVLQDESLRGHLREHGFRQAKKFSWDASAKVALQAFESLIRKQSSKQYKVSTFYDDPSCSQLLKSISEIQAVSGASNLDLALTARSIAFNTGETMPKQLLLDVSTIVHQDARSGIQRVVRSILLELLVTPPAGFNVRLIYFNNQQYSYAASFTSRVLGRNPDEDVDEVAEFNQDDIYLALDLNMHLARTLHSLHMRLKCVGVHMFYVVYDILLIRRPDWWAPGLSAMFEAWLRSVSQTATGLICISDAVADEVRDWLRLNPPSRAVGPMVSSFHLGADVENSMATKEIPEDGAALLSALRAKPSFLMVGTIEPRKGHIQTLAAFELLWKQGFDINLVIVGKQGWLVDQLADNLRQHSELNKRLFWLEGISDEYLQKIYTANNCLIAASEGEGFGLPLIEAAQHKLPIIARDIPVFREVAGKYAHYFSGLEPQALANTVKNWLSLNAEGNAPQSVDMPWLTWKQSTQQLLRHILPEGMTENVDKRELECNKKLDPPESNT